ncbi:MAG: glycosyltransferase family 39 protein [Pseudomonadota bacterium]
MHPLEFFVQKHLSLDHQLLPWTVYQLRLLEKGLVLAALLFTVFFFLKHRFKFSSIRINKMFYCVILISAILLRVVSASRGFEEMVSFDSVHYAVPAAELISSGTLSVPINQTDHPMSKAPGFSMMLAPFYLVFGSDLGAGVFCPLLLGILSLLIIYRLGRKIADEQTALLALLLLSFSPLHISNSRIILPMMAPLFLVLGALLLLADKKTGTAKLMIAGFLLGFAAAVRYLAIAAVPAAVVYLLMQNEREFKLKRSASLLLGAIIPLAGLFYYQWREFGSPLLTGYSYWTHFTANIQRPFSLSYASRPAYGASSNILYNLISSTGAEPSTILSARPDQIALAIIIWLFAVFGLVQFYRRDRPFFFFSAIFFAAYYLPHVFLFSQSTCYMLPVAPIIILSAAAGIGRFFKKAPAVIFIGLLTFIPFAYSYSHPPFETLKRDYLDFMKNKLPDGSFLISDFEPILFTHQVGRSKNVTFIAVSPNVAYADLQFYFKGKIFPPAVPLATDELVRGLLEDKKPLFLSSYSGYFDNEFAPDYQRIFQTFNLTLVVQTAHFKLYRLDK